jgi:hypothetical protein
MQSDEIDDNPDRRRGLSAESSRSLTENSANRGHVGHFEGHRSDSFLQESDRTKRDDPRRVRDRFSDDVATEIRTSEA